MFNDKPIILHIDICVNNSFRVLGSLNKLCYIYQMMLGFIFALIVSVLFAVYAMPRKHAGATNVILYTMWMGIAYFVCTIILISIVWGLGLESPENLLSPYHLLTVLRGLIWVLGMATYNIAIDKIGLTRFNQWKNIQGPVGSLLILFFIVPALGLTISGIQLLYLTLGIIVMFASALLFQIKTNTEHAPQNTKNTRLGIICALFCGVCFGITATLNSWVSQPALVGGDVFTFAQLLYHSMSLIIFSAMIYMLFGKRGKRKELFKVNKKTWLPIIAGCMFMVATLLTIYSYRLIDNNAIPWSITQLNALWTVLIGVFIYREVSFKQHWLRLTAGTLMAVGACILLFLAM